MGETIGGAATIDQVKRMSPDELETFVQAKLPSWGNHLPDEARQELEVTFDRLVDYAKQGETASR